LQTVPILSSFFARRWLQVGLAALMVILLLTTYLVFWAANTSSLASERTVLVPRGASFRTVLDSLQASGVIRVRWTLDLAGRILGFTKTMKVGKYLFPRGLSNVGILKDLEEGKSRILVQVLVPEGWRMERIALQYAKHLGVDAQRFISLCDKAEFRKELGIDAESIDGYLMPDTYRFLWQTTEEEIIERMVEEFRLFYVDSLRKRQEEVKLTLPQVLTLASIVEGEALLDRERPVIAGVYLNRLKKKMRLEADPTVQYAIHDGPRKLLLSDLRYDSPYNTYLYYGLPPGPINSPGRKSILAVLYPERHSFLYFVADGTGGHAFSRNYSEHKNAVKAYRKMRREATRNQNPPS